MMQWTCRQLAEVENIMTSAERIAVYSRLPVEANETSSVLNIEENWPQKGNIRFENYTMQYPGTESPVLSNLSFQWKAGKKIGIVGRTGKNY